MDVKLLVLMFCGLNVYSSSSQLIHIQSCSRASLDTRCLLSYIQSVTGQLTNQVSSQNESFSRILVAQTQLLSNQTQVLLGQNQALTNKTEGFESQIEEISQKVTSQSELFSNQIHELFEQNRALASKTEGLGTAVEDISQKVSSQSELLSNQSQVLVEQNQALASKTEGFESQIEEISQKVTSQSELFSNQIHELFEQNRALASKTEGLGTAVEDISRKVTGQSELLANQAQELFGLASKSEGLETHIEEISRKVTSQSELLSNQMQELFEQNQALASITEGLETNMERIANQSELNTRQIIKTVERVLTQVRNLYDYSLNDESLPENCQDIYALGRTRSGVYTVYEPLSSFRASQSLLYIRKTFTVYCDQDDTNGGPGWLVFQRRQDDSVSFNRTWNEYREGFGSLSGNVWLGNQNLAIITGGDTTYELRIDLEDWSNERRYARYSTFRVLGESDLFKLLLGEYSGDAGGDSMSWARNRYFSTPDMDNDPLPGYHCAQKYYWAGFWYWSCGLALLNNPYSNTANVAYKQGISWNHWHRHRYSMKAVQMKIRPV